MLTVHRNLSVQQDQQDALFAFSLLQLIAYTYFDHLFENLFGHHQEALYIPQLVRFVRYYVGWLLAGLLMSKLVLETCRGY
jgi:hypothetical protein